MENVRKQENRMLKVLGTLLCMYVITGAALLLLAFLLYRLKLQEYMVSIGIMVIYVAAGLAGGFLAGKKMGSRKFLWGILMGAVYFLILLAGSVILNRGLDASVVHMITTLVMCMAAGMIGGMLA